MGLQVHRHERHVVMPWANGGGTTREVARASHAGAIGFDWRLSFADVVASGPFSTLVGVDRVIMLADGKAMTLIVDGVEHVLRAGAPYRFPGEADVRCTPEGATVDFNVMTRRGHWTTEVACHELAGHGEALTGVPTGGERFVAVLTGSVAATPDAAAPVALRRYDVLQTTDPVRLTGAGLIAVVHLRPVRTTER